MLHFTPLFGHKLLLLFGVLFFMFRFSNVIFPSSWNFSSHHRKACTQTHTRTQRETTQIHECFSLASSWIWYILNTINPLSNCLSVWSLTCLSVCMSVYVRVSLYVFVYLSIYLSIYLSDYLSICVSVYSSFFLPIPLCLPIYVSVAYVYVFVRPSVCLFIRPSPGNPRLRAGQQRTGDGRMNALPTTPPHAIINFVI